MPIYPVIYYNAIVAIAMDPFHAVLSTGKLVGEKNRPSWNNEQVVQTDAEISAMHTSRWLLGGLSVLINKLIVLSKVWAVNYKRKQPSDISTLSLCKQRSRIEKLRQKKGPYL